MDRPADVVALAVAIAGGELDALSGRYLRAGVDTPQSLRELVARGPGPDERRLRVV